jgi:hypothetical protein
MQGCDIAARSCFVLVVGAASLSNKPSAALGRRSETLFSTLAELEPGKFLVFLFR